jgi:glutaredoxin 3
MIVKARVSIKKKISMHNLVEIYTADFCGYCYRAIQLLKSRDIKYKQYDVTLDRAGRQAMTQRASGKTSVPQIFINDTHIGGSDELVEIALNGRLDELLAS